MEDEREALPDLPERLLPSLLGAAIDAGAPAESEYPRPVAGMCPASKGRLEVRNEHGKLRMGRGVELGSISSLELLNPALECLKELNG